MVGSSPRPFAATEGRPTDGHAESGFPGTRRGSGLVTHAVAGRRSSVSLPSPEPDRDALV